MFAIYVIITFGREMEKMTVGEKIKARREELDMSQEELARRIGCESRSHVSRIEKAEEITNKMAKRIAAALDMSVTELIYADEVEKAVIIERYDKPEDYIKRTKRLAEYAKRIAALSDKKLNELDTFIDYLEKKNDD